jgi:NADPH-dependent glutamate synthase beta subunit-like oxidoreductase/formate hydrogenlyase subunit 6/NADH:ubiquinone oxidoreductase subunit I
MKKSTPLTPALDALLGASVPCRAACPAGTNVPAYLEAIARGDFDEAYRINLRDNVFPAVLGHVCTRPCELACRHGAAGNGEPVAICFCKRSAAHFMENREPVVLEPLFGPSGKTVAVVGTGVAGLTTARELARMGHRVTVFEKHDRPGGMLLMGIPHFRLPRDVVEREIEQIRRQGVEFKCITRVGSDIELVELIAKFDHVVVAAGAQQPNIIPVPGHDLEGVVAGLHFLAEISQKGPIPTGRRVIVLGGGFTATDCARSARRLHAEQVAIYYRRSEKDMLISDREREELNEEQVELHTLASPVEILGEGGRVRAVRFRRAEPGAEDASGRRSFREVPGSEFEVPCDMVLLGTGQSHDTAWTGRVIQLLLKRARPGEGSHATSIPGITQTGDFATGSRTLIDAIAHGKDCARVVDRQITGRERFHDVFASRKVESTGRSADLNRRPRHQPSYAGVGERNLLDPDEKAYRRETAIAEAQRCYLCHYVYEIDVAECIFCHECLDAKPLAKCIVKISDLVRDQDGRVTGYAESDGGVDYQQLYIDPKVCIRCNACREVCPVECIHIHRIDRFTVPVEGGAGTKA